MNTSIPLAFLNNADGGMTLNDTWFEKTPDATVRELASNADTLKTIRFVVQKVLVPIVTSIGFLGNAISIRVLTHRSMVSSTNCYLTALAIFDMLYLIFSFSLSLKHYSVLKDDVFHYWYPYGKVLTDICSNVSVCLTVTFSLERLVAVLYPMKGRVFCTPRRARLISGVVVLLVTACTCPEFFESELVITQEDNKTVKTIEASNMAKTDSYQIGYYNFLVFTFTILPLILLSTFNGILLKTVFAASRLRKRMTNTIMRKDSSRRQTEQNRITIMLIVVVIVFLICQFPNAALLFYYMYIESQSILISAKEQNNIRIAGNIVNLLVLINASINFVLYSVMSTKFRKVCLRICFNCKYTGRDFMTESSFYYGRTQNTAIPLRFRSSRSSKSSQRNVQTLSGRHLTKIGHCTDGKLDQRLHGSADPRGSRWSSGDSNLSDATDETNATPIVMRKVGKSKSPKCSSISGRQRQQNTDLMASERVGNYLIETPDREIYQASMIKIEMLLSSRTPLLSCSKCNDSAV